MATDTAASVTIRIPTPLRKYTGDASTVEVDARTVGGALRALVEAHPDLEANLYTDDGALRQFVNVYLDDEDVRYLDGPDTPVDDGAEISVVPSIAGGTAQAGR